MPAAMMVAALAILSLLMAGCASDQADAQHVRTSQSPQLNSSSLTPIAVVVVDNTDLARYRSAMLGQELSDVEDQFARALADRGYAVLDQVTTLAAAHQINLGSGLDDSGAVRLGQMTHVPAVLLVRLTQYSRTEHRVPGQSAAPRSFGSDYGGSGAGMSAGGGGAQRPPSSFEPAASEYEVVAAVTARLISVQTGDALWIAWDSHTASRMSQRDDDGGVLRRTCQDIILCLPSTPGQK